MISAVALVDCNNFYASCERLFRPDLKHRPIVVLSNNDGCIISRSNEAKALNIPMGEPVFLIEHLLAQNGVEIFSSNYPLYADLSRKTAGYRTAYSPSCLQMDWHSCFRRNRSHKNSCENGK
jgi:DNA polymerase V